jgi:hypothetical protein
VGRPHHPSTSIQSHHDIPSYPSTGRKTISTLFTTNGVRTRENEMRFLVPFTSVNSYKNSFFPSTLEQSSIRYHKNAIPRGFHGRDCLQLPLDQPQMFLTRSFYPAPVIFCKYTNQPPSRVHSQLCENVPEESCTLMEEDQHKDHYIIAANHVLCKLLIT